MTQRKRPLNGKIAMVSGATWGAGRGIARALGEAGATVYCTGRSIRGKPSPYGRSETIDETAEMINATGGTAIAARVDHTVESEVEDFFSRIDREHGRLDILSVVHGSLLATTVSLTLMAADRIGERSTSISRCTPRLSWNTLELAAIFSLNG